jgi:hypothetical protein
VTECPVPPIDFSLFWKVSAVVVVTGLLPLANFILTVSGKVEELKDKIRESIGRDDDAGVPYRAPAWKREVLEYDLAKRVRWLLMCVVAQIACVLMYLVLRNGWPVNLSAFSRVQPCVSVAATYLGLLPVTLSFVIFMRSLFYYVRLWRVSSEV